MSLLLDFEVDIYYANRCVGSSSLRTTSNKATIDLKVARRLVYSLQSTERKVAIQYFLMTCVKVSVRKG